MWSSTAQAYGTLNRWVKADEHFTGSHQRRSLITVSAARTDNQYEIQRLYRTIILFARALDFPLRTEVFDALTHNLA